MDDNAATARMQRFGKAYFSRDRALLAREITEDAEWHFAFGADPPDGRVRKGIDGFMAPRPTSLWNPAATSAAPRPAPTR